MIGKKLSVKKTLLATALVAGMAIAGLSGCTSAAVTGADQATDRPTENRGDHQREGSESGGESAGEESGTTYALDETYDVLRKGSRLILAYDAASNAFVGTVENTTDDVLPNVRVEVHLSNGTELGPTTPVDLAPGEMIAVTLPVTAQAFDGWTPHAEVGNSEHGGSGESGGSESGGEHGNGGESDGEHGDGGEGSGG